MASITTDQNGNRRLQFKAPDGRRQTIRLGQVTKKVADQVRYHVEEIIAARTANVPLNPSTAQWVTTLSDTMSERLAVAGLVKRQERVELGQWLDHFVEIRKDVKPATKTNWGHTVRNLKEFFGEEKDPREINLAEAEQFKQYLIGLKLKSATVSKRLQNAKMFFRRMTKEKIISENPFDDVKYYHANDKKKNAIIDRKLYDRIMEAMPDIQWRAIVALARIGALRCPSEVLSLRWKDIDWPDGWMNVRSPKNEHHPGREVRQVPLFAELRKILTEARELAPKGTKYVIWKTELRSGIQGPRGWQNGNLRGRFNHFLQSSGIPQITKPFQSMRSSRENEMVEEYPLKCVVDWVGHDIKVAAKHYLDSTSGEHHQKAVLGHEKVTQNPTHTVTERGRNKVQAADRQENKKAASAYTAIPCGVIPGGAISAHPQEVGDEGLEPPTSTV
jgi:integrase